MKSTSLLVAFTLISIACTRAVPGPAPGPATDPQQPPIQQEIGSARGPWTFSPTSIPLSYRSVEIALLELRSPTPRRDSLTTTTDFTVRISRSPAATRVMGTIESLTRTASTSFEPDSSYKLPLSFTGSLRDGGLVLDSVAGQASGSFTSCESAGLNRITAVQRNIILPPAMLTKGQTWTDSSTVPACTGTIPVQLTTVRQYHVLGEGSDGSVTLDRSDRVLAAGEGAQGQHRITLRAQGSGSSRMSLDRITGSLTHAESEYRIAVTIGSSGRVQEFAQVVRETTFLRLQD